MDLSIIGAGNVGNQLGLAFFKAGHRIIEVCARNEKQGQSLAGSLKAEWVREIKDLSGRAQVSVFCIPDPALRQLKGECGLEDKIVCHTSGSTPMDVLSGISSKTGVFYPLQTLSRDIPLDFQEVPLCLEASSDEVMAELDKLAFSVSGSVHHLNSCQRKATHLAAVIACNFPNYLFLQAEKIMDLQGLPFELLHPIIRETSRKAVTMGPRASQTGPAIRRDKKTMEDHLDMLSEDPVLHDLYLQLSNAIMNDFNKKQLS